MLIPLLHDWLVLQSDHVLSLPEEVLTVEPNAVPTATDSKARYLCINFYWYITQ